MIEFAAVLDASALLAYLRGEGGAAVVREILIGRAAISAVNWSEVLAKLAEAGEPPEQAAMRIHNVGLTADNLTVHPFTGEHAIETARLRPVMRHLGLSLGDRACLALGRLLGLPVLTADTTWLESGVDVQIRTIR